MNLFDSANYPSAIPAKLTIGDLWAWKRSDLGSDYAPASYTLKYALRLDGAGSTEIEITATASGNDYLVEVSQSVTAALTAGVYRWQAYITRNLDSERVTIDSGSLEVIANRDAATSDPRSHAKIMVDAIEALLEKKATKDQLSYSINGRSLTRLNPSELLEWRDYYRAEYKKEQQKSDNDAGRSNRSNQIKFYI